MGDEIFDLSIENGVLRKKIGNVDEEWMETKKKESKQNYNSEAKNRLILSRLERRCKKAAELRQ